MPFTVYKVRDGWKIKKPSDNTIYPVTYKTQQSAVRTAKNWLRYRKEPTNLVKVSSGRGHPQKRY